MEQSFNRANGLDFDPWYYQSGEPLGDGVYQVEIDFFLEQSWKEDALREATAIYFHWHGEEYAIAAPRELGDMHLIRVDGVPVGPGSLDLVLVKDRSWSESLGGLFGRQEPRILESRARARLRR